MKLKPNVALSANGFVFDPATGDSFAGNAVAGEMLANLQRGEAPAAIKAGIVERYEVSTSQVERDWDDLLGQLRAFGLLDG